MPKTDTSNRSILITGGFGFLGSHLVEKLLEDAANRVHVVDNLSTSPIDVEAYLKRLNRPPHLTYDICSVEEYCQRPNRERRFDEVFHLASIVGPVGVLSHAGKIAKNIVEDTYWVLDLVRKDGAKLCDISTSEVYGGGRDGYCSENDTKIIPAKNSVRLEYAVGKLACEVALMNTATVDEGFWVTIVRPFNIAGPRQAPKGGFVLPRFIGQALANEPLTVYGDGKMVRAFTHVKDMVDGILRTMRHGKRGHAYNIGNPNNKTTILELAQSVVRVTKTKSRIEFVDPKKLFGHLFEEANDKYPDADRAVNELGWHPEHDIDKVISDSLEYIRAGRLD